MTEARVASRYVKSLLSLAVEQGVLEEVYHDMRMFASICQENRDFMLMLKSPIISHERKRGILGKIFDAKVNKLTMAIFDILTKKNREPLLPAIAHEFHHAYNVFKGIGEASITTAVPLDSALRAEFEAVVKNISQREQVELVEKIDQDMIGGFVLNVGDKQIDASIKNKLKLLKVKLSHNPYIKDF